MLRFDDVVAALGRVAEHDLGLQTIPVQSIVGTVNRRNGEFDRMFRPRSRRLQRRWQRIAAARRRGETVPPIDVYRIGELHFVQDGHHRVSVARAHGDTTIDARVRAVQTTLAATDALMPGELRLTRKEQGARVPRAGAAASGGTRVSKLAGSKRGAGSSLRTPAWCTTVRSPRVCREAELVSWWSERRLAADGARPTAIGPGGPDPSGPPESQGGGGTVP
jgi:hypothetical protein